MKIKLVETKITKTFDDLIKEIHEPGLCGECGGCVSFCSAGEIGAIEMSKSGPPKYSNKDNCRKCGICYFICPQTRVLNDVLNIRFNFEPPIGHTLKVSATQASSEKIRAEATDGGAVTAILSYLLKQKLIDGAIVSKKIGPLGRIPFFATTEDELLEAAGSHYDISDHVVGLEKYTTFIPTNIKLKQSSADLLNVAVVGTPCQIHSIRKMQVLGILPAHIVKYTLGLFCYFNFSFGEDGRKGLEEKYNFSFNDVVKINIKENLILQLKDKKELHIDFNDLHGIVRPACFGCRDFANVYADISFGGLGSPDGYTTTIVRTKTGEEIYSKALEEGYLTEPKDLNKTVKTAEMLDKVVKFGRQKFERYKHTLDKIKLK